MYLAQDSNGKMYLYNDRPIKIVSPLNKKNWVFMGSSATAGTLRIKTNFKLKTNPQKVIIKIEEA